MLIFRFNFPLENVNKPELPSPNNVVQSLVEIR